MVYRRSMLVLSGLVVVASLVFLVIYVTSTCCTANIERISPVGYQDRFMTNGAAHVLIDVRTPEEFATGHIQGALNIPVDALAGRLSEVPSDQTVVVYCRSGNRSAQASQILAQAGYGSIYDLGGINDWTAQGFAVE